MTNSLVQRLLNRNFNDNIRDKKLKLDIRRAAGKISTLLSCKIDKYDYLTGADILPTQQHRLIEYDKFSYSPFGKVFEKQVKSSE